MRTFAPSSLPSADVIDGEAERDLGPGSTTPFSSSGSLVLVAVRLDSALMLGALGGIQPRHFEARTLLDAVGDRFLLS